MAGLRTGPRNVSGPVPILGTFGAMPFVCHAMKKRCPPPPEEVDPDATDRLPAPDFGDGDTDATGSWAEDDRPGSRDEDDLTREMPRLSADEPVAEPPMIDDAFAELNRVLREQAATIARLEVELGTAGPADTPADSPGGAEGGVLKEQLQHAERERLDLAVELDEHRAAFVRMEDELGVAREAAEAAQRQREAAEQARRAAEQERDRLQAALAAAEAARQQAVARADEVSVELAALPQAPLGDALEQEKQHLKDRIAELRNAVTVVRAELAEVAGERDALRKRVDAGNGELADLRTQLAARGQRIDGLLERLRSAEALRRFRSDFRAAERSPAAGPKSAAAPPGLDPRVAELEQSLAAERAARSRSEEALDALRAQWAAVGQTGAVPPSGPATAPTAQPSAETVTPSSRVGVDPGSVMDQDPEALQWRLSMLAAELARREERITELEDELRRQHGILDGIREGLGLGQDADPPVEAAQPEANVTRANREPPRLTRYLTRLDGNDSVIHVISKPRVSIGRTSGNELQIRESYISRHHASILIGPENAIVEDAGSSNGVFLNDRRVRRELLRDGDIVAFGKARFRYQVRKPEHAPD